MGDDRESPLGGTQATVPIDAFPDPILGYERRGESLVVVDRNPAFERAFESVPVGATVSEWLTTETSADEQSVADLRSTLADGRRVDTTVGQDGHEDTESEYRLRTLAEAGESDDLGGLLIVTDAGSTPSTDVEVDRIASVISHDLRNPLDVANIHLRAARETGDAEHFDQVKQSHDRMERIIQDVLTLARGEHVLNVTADVGIEDVARDAWATVETESASLTVAEDLPATDADPDRLQRLFENLFRNAVEHGSTSPPSQAPEDAVEHGSTSSRPEADDAVEHGSASPPSQAPEDAVEVRVGRIDGGFFVADDGVGIPPAERERVFDPGYSSNETGDGTGLGLTIVERIAEAHDWTVSLTTGSAGGARFEFRPASDSD
jgi:signal transduction histidine kinase